ncbi:MAG: FAD-dependent oxidoreductase, partial [Oscillospiraceae bacterium]
ALGREEEWAIPELQGEPKKVLVVGGGPAGLSAARVAAVRGHKVTLIEKNFKVGGQINLAAVPPYKIEVAKWINYLYTQCKKLGVNIKYGVEATEENIKAEHADAIIMATGSNPLIAARIPGFNTLEKVVTSHDILAGRAQALNGRVLVLGGGLVGCETADHLCQTARGDIDVTILEMLPRLVSALSESNRVPLMASFRAHGVTVRTSTKLLEFQGRDVVVEYKGEKQILKDFDHIIWGMGARPNNALNDVVKNLAPVVKYVGDCNKIGTARNAIEDGYKAACEI